MVQLKDFVIGIFSKYYWGIVLVLGLVGLLFLVIIPNTDFIMGKFGIETKTSLREQRNQLLETVNELKVINKKNSEEIVLIKDRYERQLSLAQSTQKERVVIQEKIKVIKEKIKVPQKQSLSIEEADVYYNALNEAYNLAKGESS